MDIIVPVAQSVNVKWSSNNLRYFFWFQEHEDGNEEEEEEEGLERARIQTSPSTDSKKKKLVNGDSKVRLSMTN